MIKVFDKMDFKFNNFKKNSQFFYKKLSLYEYEISSKAINGL